MSDKKFNFNLGNRSLTADESKAVEIAKEVFRRSVARHQGATVAGRAVFEATANAKPAGEVNRARGLEGGPGNVPAKPRGTDVVNKVPSSWTTNTVVPANRKY